MDLDNIQRKYGLPAPLPVVQNGKFAPIFPLNLEHRGDDVFQFGGKYIGEIENIYDLLYKILTNQEIDASLALPYAIKITEDKLYVRDKTNSEWILIFDITKPNFPKEIELYELIYKAITHQVIGEDTSYPGQFKIEENILYVRDKDNLIWTQIGDVTKEFLGATEATQAILEQVNEILIEVQELKTELNRQIATTNETLTTALQAANEAMTSAQSINIRTFNSVEEMKASNTLKVGALAKTLGFYTADDGGGADYVITNDIDEDETDEASIIALQNELYAKLLIKDYINIKWFGAKIDGETDDSTAFNKAVSYIESQKVYSYNTVDSNFRKLTSSYSLFIPKGNMLINNTITVNVGVMSLIADGTIIQAKNINGVAMRVWGDTDGSFASNPVHRLTGFHLIGQRNVDGEEHIGILFEGESAKVRSASRVGGTFATVTCFDKGIVYGANYYADTHYNLEVRSCNIGVYFKPYSNSGERPTFISCNFYWNGIDVVSELPTKITFKSCSFDYSLKFLENKTSEGRIYYHDCHFEWGYSENNKDGAMFKTGYQSNVNASNLVFDSCDFAQITSASAFNELAVPRYNYLIDTDVTLVGFGYTIFDKCQFMGLGIIYNSICKSRNARFYNSRLINPINYAIPARQFYDGYKIPLSVVPTNIYTYNATLAIGSNSSYTVRKIAEGDAEISFTYPIKDFSFFSFFCVFGSTQTVSNCQMGIRYEQKDKNGNLVTIAGRGGEDITSIVNSAVTEAQNKAFKIQPYVRDNVWMDLGDMYISVVFKLTNFSINNGLNFYRYDFGGY